MESLQKGREIGSYNADLALKQQNATRTVWLLPSNSFACKHTQQQGNSCTQVVYPAGHQQLVLTLVTDLVSTADVIGFLDRRMGMYAERGRGSRRILPSSSKDTLKKSGSRFQ